MRYVLAWQNWQGETISRDTIEAESLREAIQFALALCPKNPDVMNLDIILLVQA